MSDKAEAGQDKSEPSLADLKADVRKKFIGKAGIHGVGLRSKDHAVRVYATEIGDDEQEHTFDQIRNDIAPVSLEVVFDAPAVVSKQAVDKSKI